MKPTMNFAEKSADMEIEEMNSIATAMVVYKFKENLVKNKKFWMNLKETDQLNRELGNIQKSTEIDSETIKNFGAIILAKDAPEIFGKPEREMSNMEIGYISYKMLIFFVRRNGIRILPENQERRILGNIAAATGIKKERLIVFGNIFLKAAVDIVIFPAPLKSPCQDCIKGLTEEREKNKQDKLKGQTIEQIFDLV